MESILWACDLLALVYLCFWAIRQDKAEQAQQPQSKPKSQFRPKHLNDSAGKAPEFSPASLQE